MQNKQKLLIRSSNRLRQRFDIRHDKEGKDNHILSNFRPAKTATFPERGCLPPSLFCAERDLGSCLPSEGSATGRNGDEASRNARNDERRISRHHRQGLPRFHTEGEFPLGQRFGFHGHAGKYAIPGPGPRGHRGPDCGQLPGPKWPQPRVCVQSHRRTKKWGASWPGPASGLARGCLFAPLGPVGHPLCGRMPCEMQKRRNNGMQFITRHKRDWRPVRFEMHPNAITSQSRRLEGRSGKREPQKHGLRELMGEVAFRTKVFLI